MPKSDRLFKFLQLVKAQPYITIADVAKKVGISERGIYRYTKTLKSIGIPIETKRGCILGESKIEEFISSLGLSETELLREALIRSQIGDDNVPRVEAVDRLLAFIAKTFPDLDETTAKEADRNEPSQGEQENTQTQS